MVSFRTLLLIVLFTQTIVIEAHNWFPDPERLETLQTRWNKYKAIPSKTKITVTAVCGPISSYSCSKPVSRPSDEEMESCDKYCCHSGYLTGFCKTTIDFGVKGNYQPSHGPMQYKPSVKASSNCLCTNDLKDAKCGPDASLLGIRCPVDLSACQRKCCRQGGSGGYCGGFLNLKCKCD